MQKKALNNVDMEIFFNLSADKTMSSDQYKQLRVSSLRVLQQADFSAAHFPNGMQNSFDNSGFCESK